MFRKIAMAFAASAALALSASAQEKISLGDFAAGTDNWTFSNGKEFPGAEGNLWQDEAKKAAVLEGYFANGGAYVGMLKSFPEPIALKEVTVKITSNELKSFTFRITDSTGQTFQQRVELPNAEKGAVATIKNFAGGKNSGSWGGAKDGQFHSPAKGIAILLDKGHLADPANSPKGQLIVESVEGKL